tara:strand:- start:72 stop:287 length:216 start_codon:yes stop_codon:yes gene_type:complete
MLLLKNLNYYLQDREMEMVQFLLHLLLLLLDNLLLKLVKLKHLILKEKLYNNLMQLLMILYNHLQLHHHPY